MSEDYDDYMNYCSGSTDFDLATVRAMAKPYNLSWGREFPRFYEETLELLKRLFRTDNEVVAIVGTIRAAWDAALCSLIQPGDQVLIPTNGGYWHNFAVDIVRTYEGVPVLVEGQPRRPIAPELVSEALDRHPGIKLVMIIHVDTDGGIVNRSLDEIGRVIREKSSALYLVDAATSLAADAVNVDAWGADICFSGSHKGLSSPAGLAFLTVSANAWRRIEEREVPIRAWYTSLLTWREVDQLTCVPGKIPFSFPVSILRAVRRRLDYIFAQGLDHAIAQHEIAARAIRECVLAMGLELYADSAVSANSMTYVMFPDGVEPGPFETAMAQRYGLVTISQPYNQDGFIVGTINEYQVHPRNLLSCLTAVGLVMKRLGADVDLAAGLDAAAGVLAERPNLGSGLEN
jgi:aspartate aminotransferase-like enzyme